jgi:hypothetical protein
MQFRVRDREKPRGQEQIQVPETSQPARIQVLVAMQFKEAI